MINYAVGTYTGIKAYSRVHDGMWRGMDGNGTKHLGEVTNIQGLVVL